MGRMLWHRVSIAWKFQIANCALLVLFYTFASWVYEALWLQRFDWPEMIMPITIMVGIPTFVNEALAAQRGRVMLVLLGLLAAVIVTGACWLVDVFVHQPEIRWWGQLAWSAIAGIAAAAVVYLLAHLICPWNLYSAAIEIPAKHASN